MILEYLDEARFGKQIPYTVPHDRPLHDLYAQEPVKTRNLCRGLARTMLALARIPQPRIGAFRVCPNGAIRLDGRPVACSVAILEGEGAPRTIGLDTTYTSAGRYVSGLIRFYESVFRAGPNMAQAKADAENQMAIMASLRATAHHFVELGGGDGEDGGDGPYLLHLSDSNASNILIDDDWQVTAIFDLEWLFAAPVAQLRTPSWLTWQAVDDITGQGYDDYCASRDVFMDVFREEERTQTGTDKTPLSDAMDASWASQRTWFYAALTSVNGMTQIFSNRLQPLFWREDEKAVLPYEALYPLWQPGAQAVVAQKVRDREQHVAAVERLFQDQ